MAKSKLSLAGSPFTANAPIPLQATGIIYGTTGALKSYTVFSSCPQPILTFNFDGGRDLPAFHRAQEEGVEIYRAPFFMPEEIDKMEPDQGKKIARKHADDFWKAYDWAIDRSIKNEIGTICIDTFNELKPILCGSVCGQTEIGFKQYRAQGILNQLCRSLIVKAKRGRAHLVIIARESEIYVDDKGTGRYKPKVPQPLVEESDWSAYLKVDTKRRGKDLEIIPKITMSKCGGNFTEVGRTYTPDDWEDDGPFAWICYNQWLNSKLEDWK